MTRVWEGRLAFNSWQRQVFFLFTTVCRSIMGPTQPPIKWVLEALSLRIQ